MKNILVPQFARGMTLAAAAVLFLATAPHQRAEAMSLITPGAVPGTTKAANDDLVTPVRHGGGGFHGGGFRGGGFHGGGFHGGGFRGGGWHGGRAHFGGFRHFGGHRFVGHRFAGHRFVGHRFVGHRFAHFPHRRVFFAGFYPAYYPYYSYPRCRIIWTYYGPQRVCGYRPWWHRRYYW